MPSRGQRVEVVQRVTLRSFQWLKCGGSPRGRPGVRGRWTSWRSSRVVTWMSSRVQRVSRGSPGGRFRGQRVGVVLELGGSLWRSVQDVGFVWGSGDSGYSPVCSLIQLRNFVTRVYTPGLFLRAHPSPQLTTPAWKIRPLSSVIDSGPPESPCRVRG